MRKRITSLLLTLVMLLSLVPAMGVTALAASGDGSSEGNPRVVTTYEDWKAAMQQSDETYIKLGDNIDTSTMNSGFGLGANEWIRVQADIHLDLNGHKLTLLKSKMSEDSYSYLIGVLQGSLTIEDTTGTGGEIVGLHQVTNDRMQLIDVGKGAKLTLNSGKLHLEVNADSNAPNATIRFKGAVEINGGTVSILKKGGKDEPSSYIYKQNFALEAIRESDNCCALINGGTFDGRVLLKAVAKASGVADNVITGGDFKKSIYILKDKTVTGDVPLNVSIQGGTYRYTPGYYTFPDSDPFNGGKKMSDPSDLFQFATMGFVEKSIYHDGSVHSAFNGNDYSATYDINAFASMFPKNAIITAEGQEYDYYETRKDAPQHISVSDAAFTGSSSALDLAHLVNSHYKTITVTTLPSDALKDMKLTVGDGTPLPAQGNSTVSGDVTLGSDGTLTKTVYISALGNKQLKEMYYSNPSKIDFGYRLNIFKDGVRVTDYTGDSLTYAALGDEISVSVQLRDFEFEEGVYTFRLALWPYLRGSEAQIGENLVGLWKLTAEKEPPAPVAHSIKIINGFGTANPTTAIAGETVTVKVNDRTADNMMFTQWYTETAGVTFANATQRETTFTMPDCDVKVNPGYQQVLFTKQPVPQISLEQGYGGKTSFVFSWDISKWELVDTATNQTVSSDNTPVKAGKLTDVTIPANTDLGSKTYRIVVTTANGEQFKSNDFIVTWFEKMPAPLVEFSIPSDTKFIGEMKVNVGCPSTLENGDVSPFETCYTTNGVDPKEADPSDIQRYSGRTDVTLTQNTHFMARTILEGEGGNEDTWGELCEATYTMIDKLDAPTVTPTSCRYSGSLPIIVTIQDVYNAKISYTVKQHDGYLSGKEVDGPMLKTGLPDTFCGTTTFSAKAIVYKDGGGAWESDEVTYTYTREYWANISNATISGKVNEAIAATDVTITLDGEKFKNVAVGDDVSGWFNLPAGLTAKVKEQTDDFRKLVITISGTPTAGSTEPIAVTIPKDKLLANGTADLTVLSNPKAVYNIGTDAVHTHTYGAWTMLDDSQHSRSCTCGDVQFEVHDFSAWTKVDDTNHSRTCKKCTKPGETANYTETANHNWQWVVDAAATPNAAGKQHEECVDCHAKRSENTVIPMLTSIMVENLTVAKPVKDAAATAATTTDSTYTVANTEWMAADGTPLAIGDKFQPGTVYTVKITLETAGAGVFSVKSTYNTIEGKTATVSPALTGDAHADSVELTYTFDATEGTYVPTKPAITTVTLPDGKVGDAYNQTLTATGTNPITWGIETGNLPDGLTLVGDTIKGTPSKAGDFKFTVKATNGGGSDTKELTIKIADAEAAKYHNVTLTGAGTGATGAGSHAAGTTVNIYAGTKSGYTFNGWTSDDVTVLSASSKNASFVMPDKDVTVKANWVYNGGSSGGGYTYYTIKATAGVNGSISPTGNVSVREGRDQTFTITPNKGYAVAKVLIDSKNVGAVKSYTFENVKKNHTIEVVFMKASGNPQTGVFVDVPEGSYYEEAVNWAVEKGITTGTDATHFSPDGICTRAQAVTFLWRAAGSPAAKSAVMPFADVKAGSYYYDAVLWAVENGITKGTSETMVSPDATCSRAQIVTFLWRSQKSPAAGTANPFTDVKASAYYADAVLWAVKEDVTKGTTNTTFSPDANCTRAQIVTFIWRALAE